MRRIARLGQTSYEPAKTKALGSSSLISSSLYSPSFFVD
jgi:hypothetical protein